MVVALCLGLLRFLFSVSSRANKRPISWAAVCRPIDEYRDDLDVALIYSKLLVGGLEHFLVFHIGNNHPN